MSDRLQHRASWLGAVIVVHGALIALYWLPEGKALLGDEHVYLRAAREIVETGRSGLDSFWPPAYAWFLAPLVAAAGGSVWLVQVFQTVLLVVAALLLRHLVLRWLGDRWSADLALVLTLLHPPLVAFAHYLWPEILHLVVMLAAVALLTASPPRWLPVMAGGLLLALCLQTKLLLLPLLPAAGVGLWLLWPPGRRAWAMTLLVATLAAGVLPTVLARQRELGRPMLASSGWFNAWVGLNEVSAREFSDSIVVEEYSRYRDSARSVQARNRIVREKIAHLVREQGLGKTLGRQLGRQYVRLFGRSSFLTQQLAGGEVWAAGGGYSAGASPATLAVRWLAYASWAVIVVLAAWGAVSFPYRKRPVGWWVLGFLVAQCALFLVLHVKSRYRLQMLPELFFFAVWAAARWGGRLDAEAGGGALRRVAAAGLALLLLGLGFTTGR